MNDWIGLGIIIILVGGLFYALMRANEPRAPLTEEEFQKRAQESRGLAGAGFSALQQMLDPSTKRAEAVIEDMRQGYLDGEQESGDGNDTTPEENEKGKIKNEKAEEA
ncbi:MAG TPA: hypothetical protein VGC66_16635 [Pyrinomonadaceae bacterium]|jgi:hypothetical protein